MYLSLLSLPIDAYTTDQLHYIWKHGADRSIKMSKDMRLSQFDLTGHPADNLTVRNRSGKSVTALKGIDLCFRCPQVSELVSKNLENRK